MIPGRKIHCSPRTASGPPSKEIWLPLRLDGGLPVQLRPQYRPYQKYPRYTGFLACMSTISIYWGRSASGSTHPA